MRRANRIQQPDERETIFLTEPLERLLVRARSDCVDLCQHLESFLRNPAEVLPPIFLAALAANQFLGFQAIEQPSDAWRPFDHTVAHLERRKPFVPGAAQDAEDVELLQGDAVWFDERSAVPADHIRGPHQTDDRFVRGRLERAPLAKFTLQSRGHGKYITRQ